MKAVVFLALMFAASCALASNRYLSTSYAATATYYNAQTTGAACHQGNWIAPGYYKTALSEKLYQKSAMCGICFEVKGKSGAANFTVTDLCPASDPSKFFN